MLRRTGIALLVALVGASVAFLVHFNRDPATLHLGPEVRIEGPLALHLLAAFALGTTVVLVLAGLRAGANRVRDLQDRRAERREDAARRMRDDGGKLLWSGELDGAAKLLARAVEGLPDDIDAALALAAAQERRGELDSARRTLDTARAHHGADPRLLSRTARLALRRGSPAMATDALREAVAVAPHSPRLLAELADALAGQGLLAEAIATARKLVADEREPARREEAERRLVALRYREAVALGDTPAGIDALRRLCADAPDFLPAPVLLAQRARLAGDARTAERVLREALRRRPRGVLLERWRTTFTDDGHPEKALGTLRDACAGNRLLAPRLAVARTLVATGKLEAADAELREIARDGARRRRDGEDAGPEIDLVAAELAAARGHDREAAGLYARAAAGSHQPFGYACATCGRAAPDWRDACACGAHGTYDWAIR